MGLLDHLFKPKPESGGEKKVEQKPAGGGNGGHVEESRAFPDPSAFLHPKDFVPRGATVVVPTARNATKHAELHADASAAREIVLALGDVLPRIPPQYLSKGAHDVRREIRIPAADLASDIARGRATIALSKIAALCPDIFHSPIAPADETEVRLPLQKLLDQLGLCPDRAARHPIAQPAVEAARATFLESVAALPNQTERPVPQIEAPVSPPQGEEKIFLSLAAILARCPDEIFVGERPRVSESVRVAFPFAPIERQLVGGKVEITSLRFVSLLPVGYRRYFQPIEGVKIPLPLEEIFQNLPGTAPVDAPTEDPIIFAAPAPAEAGVELARPELPPPRQISPPLVTLLGGIPVAGPVRVQAKMPAPNLEAPVEGDPAALPVDSEPAPAKEPQATEAASAVSTLQEPEPAVEASGDFAPRASVTPHLRPPEVQVGSDSPLSVDLIAAVLQSTQPEPAAVLAPATVSIQPPPRVRPMVLTPPTLRAAPEFPPELPQSFAEADPTVPAIFQPAAAELAAIAAPPPPLPPSQKFQALVEAALLAPLDEPRDLKPAPEPAPRHAPLVVLPHEDGGAPRSAAVPVRLDQENLQALFMTDEVLDLPRIAQLAAALPGMSACVIDLRGEIFQHGALPSGFDAASLPALATRFTAPAGDLPLGDAVTIFSASHAMSFFSRPALCLCAVHGVRGFLPGVREKLAVLADSLAETSPNPSP